VTRKIYRWKQNYEIGRGRKHWAISDTESEKEGRVSCAAIVLRLCEPTWLGFPFDQEPLPRRIIAALNACEGIPTKKLEELHLDELLPKPRKEPTL
jgi:hypothetical protein